MSYWHINYPIITRFVLQELRKITLGEFLDDIDFGDSINEFFGIDSDREDVSFEVNDSRRIAN